MPRIRLAVALLLLSLVPAAARAAYVNFESSHVHPIALTPSGVRLLAVNTPDALLEVFLIDASGRLMPSASIPVGLEPVTVVARNDSEAWVANRVSHSVSIVDLNLGTTIKTLRVGGEPSDIAFAAAKAFVAISQTAAVPVAPAPPPPPPLPEDVVKAYDLSNLDNPPSVVNLFGSKIRALAVSGNTVYAVAQDSGNQTTVVDANVVFGNNSNLDPIRLNALTPYGVNDMRCAGPPPPYPPMPDGMVRNPALTDPPDGVPKVGLIVKWDPTTSQWRDEAGQIWTHCLPFRMPDHDLFAINAITLGVTEIDHLGTTLFDVSVNPATGLVYVPHTEARNFVRFEPRVGGHVVDNRLAIVNPSAGNGVTLVDLNTHVTDRSSPSSLAKRMASISQPGMMVWKSDGSVGYLTAIGSRKVFVVNGTCLSGSCIFGPNRDTPNAVEVGEGPTGAALLETRNRLYVLNRFSNSIATVDTSTSPPTKTGEISLHDPSSATIRDGRRFLYDAILSSGHGDAACSSCHISGDKDGLAWDLGDPNGNLAAYTTANDNVRFIVPLSNQPVPCDPAVCAAHAGFDPQKGPMTTQTLRAMLEPLHWRGDRPTMNAFNPAFVGLLGAPASLPAADMETFRQFALGMRFPPSPHRNVDDTLPNTDVQVPGTTFQGNPARGETIFHTFQTDAGQPCVSCHSLPFGAAGGRLGGVTPQEPTSTDAAALFNGDADQGPHSDVKVPHLRNQFDKLGFLFGAAAGPYPDVKTGFGLVHDGSVPNILTFLSINVFQLSAANSAKDIRDLSSFLLHFPTGIQPAVGRHLTCPAGAPPTNPPCDESLLTTLFSLGDLANVSRHCELTATALGSGRIRSYRFIGGSWSTDVSGELPLSTTALRQNAQGPISFLCATIGSGVRLGGDRDEDGSLNGNDCAPGDSQTWAPPSEAMNLRVSGASSTQITWNDQSAATGPGVHYDVAGGMLSTLRASALIAATSCISGDLATASYTDPRANPPSGDGYYYLTRAENVCATGTFGPGRAGIDPLVCAGP